MRTGPQLVLLLALLAPLAAGGEIVDRVLLHVNHRVILQSELDETLRYEALVAQSDLSSLTEENREHALCQLVDHLFIAEDIDRRTVAHASQGEIADKLAKIRDQLPGAQSEDGWRKLLDRYGLSQVDVAGFAAEEIDIQHWEDDRFRPTIQIDSRSIETYYLEQFIPKLHQAGAGEVPLKEVSTVIKTILMEQRISEAEDAWLSRMWDEAHGDEEQLQHCRKGRSR